MSDRLRLPHNWEPYEYQKPALNAWIRDGKTDVDLIWHRRAGKDAICLHGAAVKAHQRVANYWHMLPQQNQVRKAIWNAVNPHTGQRRIDEAFPKEIRSRTIDNEMIIHLRNGSTWQCLGSDSFQNAIGSTPAGIVYSEWALSNPSASAYLDPILVENGGWQVKIGTPRGKNHAYRSFRSAQKDPDSFAQLLTVDDTGFSAKHDMDRELRKYCDKYGDDLGRALFMQEWFCAFEAAVVGAVWGAELSLIEREGHVTSVPHNPDFPVYTAWDIGRTDATSIWFYQVINNEILIIDYVEDSLKNPDWFASQVMGRRITIDLVDDEVVVGKHEDMPEIAHRKAYRYKNHHLPHDARHKLFAAKGKSIQQQLMAALDDNSIRIVSAQKKQDQITAARSALPRCYFDHRTEQGFDALKQYRYEWDDMKQKLSDKPIHDWTSHPADAFMQMAIIYQESKFISDARTPLRYSLGVIPVGRQSSAFGYSQALDGTWDEYLRDQGKYGARRDDIRDATDFMGWYMHQSTQQLGIPKTDARRQYLAYHEGRTGYRRGTYNGKAWLMRVANEVGQRSRTYQAQLASCRAARR